MSFYEKVQYVSSNLNSKLDTGIVSGNDVRVLVDAQFLAHKNDNGGNCLFGCIKGEPGDDFWYYYHCTLYSSCLYFGSGSGERSVSVNDPLARMTIDYYNNSSVLINGSTVISSLNSVGVKKNIYLFARTFSAQYAWSKARIYSCKIYKSGSLVRDFIPAVDSNGTGFLLDRVNNKSYYANLTAGYEQYCQLNNITMGNYRSGDDSLVIPQKGGDGTVFIRYYAYE